MMNAIAAIDLDIGLGIALMIVTMVTEGLSAVATTDHHLHVADEGTYLFIFVFYYFRGKHMLYVIWLYIYVSFVFSHFVDLDQGHDPETGVGEDLEQGLIVEIAVVVETTGVIVETEDDVVRAVNIDEVETNLVQITIDERKVDLDQRAVLDLLLIQEVDLLAVPEVDPEVLPKEKQMENKKLLQWNQIILIHLVGHAVDLGTSLHGSREAEVFHKAED